MSLPKVWHYYTDSPKNVKCPRGKCGSRRTKPSRRYSVSLLGVVSQLYVCTDCLWGFELRYAPNRPEQYLWATSLNPSGKIVREALLDAGIPLDEQRARLKAAALE